MFSTENSVGLLKFSFPKACLYMTSVNSNMNVPFSASDFAKQHLLSKLNNKINTLAINGIL